jgi:hypothetical protein
VTDTEWDQIVFTCIDVFVDEHQDVATAERFIERLQGQHNHVMGLIKCNKLKKAYLEAVRLERIDLTLSVKSAADASGQKTISQLCAKFLSKHGIEPDTSGSSATSSSSVMQPKQFE